MPKAILEFNLPEERDEFKLATNGTNYFCILWDIEQYLRSELKHNDKLTIDQIEILDEIRDKLREFMSNVGVSFDDVE